MLYDLARPGLFLLDPERAHHLTLAALRMSPLKSPQRPGVLATTVAGIAFPNPLGMAAGFDKNAEVSDAVLGLGFGFAEVGSITPLPQPGNPKPRLFRLAEDRAVINRMGFNNEGHAAAHRRLAGRAQGRDGRRIVGVNIGANKDAQDRVADYVAGMEVFSDVADYIAVNISSPNTPGLRDLQGEKELTDLLGAISRSRADGGPPVFVKVAPDLDPEAPARIVEAVVKYGIDGIIVSNTTISRPGGPLALKSRHAAEAGGLSGAPLRDLAQQRLRDFYAVTKGEVPLIGVGGIASAEDAWARIRAGANLVQLYSAMVYQGPGIARRVVGGLETLMRRDGFATIAEAVGSE